MTPDARMKGKSLLTLDGVSDGELTYLLDLAVELKARKRAGATGDLLRRKHVALVFEKASTRTRCAAIVAAADEGGAAEYLDSNVIHLGKKESVADTARVLGRMFDGILFRGYSQKTVEILASCAGVPVWNGLTDDWHPTQVLADLMTIRENFGRLAGLKMVYVGDGRNNVAISLMFGCARVGIDFVNCTPAALAPAPALVSRAMGLATAHNCSVRVCDNPAEAVRGANVVYTDVWVSMGEEDQFESRVRLLSPYRVNMDLIRRTGNLTTGKLVFLHCLPALHDDQTEVTRTRGALEVTNDVFEAGFSKVFDQAENRVHTLKAIMVATIGNV